MLSLIKFEFKKIAKKRANIITIVASLIITAIFFTLPSIQFRFYDKEGNQHTGLKAIALEKEKLKLLSYELTEEKITEDIEEFQRLFSNPENIIIDESREVAFKDNIYWKYINPKAMYFQMISVNYDNPNQYSWYQDIIPKINIDNGANFYETRNNKVSAILNMDYEGENYSEQEKEFWINKNSKISEPYIYGYREGWSVILSALELLIFTVIAICITMAPVFAGEYQCGADSIILSSKYGKSKVITAKIIASFVFATIVFFINVIIAVSVPLLTFGIDGWNLPIQIMNTTIPHALTFAETTFGCILVSYIVMIGMVSITLLLSAKLKTPFTVLIIDVLILFIPLFMKAGVENGVFNHIVYLLPYKALQEELGSYLCYSFGKITIGLISMRIMVYGIIGVLLIPFTRQAFRKHQVQ